MNRAYCVLEIKSTGESNGKRTFKGIATTPTTDSYGDVVEPTGAQFKLPLPLLWMHNSREPIGWVTKARATKTGIEVEGEVASLPEPASLKDRLDQAWAMLKGNLVRGLSIGFNGIEHARIEGTYGIHWLKWNWLELSAVTIPANMDASITAIRSLDVKARAASGLEGEDSSTSARSLPASGRQSRRQGAANVKTLQQMEEERVAKAARVGELIELRESDPDKFTKKEAEEIATLTDELETLDVDVSVARFQERQAANATRVSKGSAEEQSESRGRVRGGMSFSRNQDPDDKFKGQSFIRTQICRAVGMIQMRSPAAVAEERYGKTHKKLVEFIRTAVAGGGSGSGEWGAELVAMDGRFTGDFIEFLYAKTLFDQLALKPVPANVKVKGQDGAFAGYWVGQSKAIGTSAGDYSTVDLTPLKVAGIAVVSMELLEDSSPAAEGLVRDGLVEASSQKVDTTFLSAAAASSGVSPAGILNGLSALTTAGTSLANARDDLQALLYPFVLNKMSKGIELLMNPAQGLALSMLYGSLDQPAFPDVNENGGTINGRKVWTGDNVSAGDVIAIRPEDIWKIGDSGIRIDMSREATIEQTDNPTGATDTPTGATTTSMTNMFQEESVAFKVVRRINFQKRRSTAVVYMNNVEWGGVTS